MSDQNQSWLDKQMAQLIGNGDMSKMTSAGKPLNLHDETHIPEEQRLASRIMKDNNILPAWMQMGKDLDDELGAIRQRLRQTAKQYRGQLADARRASNSVLEDNAEQYWRINSQRERNNIVAFNKRILTYNISLPPNVPQRIPLNPETEIANALKPIKTGNLSISS